MADDDETTDPEAQSMIDELLAEGFAYAHNGVVTGFAGPGGDDDGDDGSGDEGTDDGGGDDADAGADGGQAGDDDDGAGSDAGGDDGGRGAHTGRLELRGTPLTEVEADGLLHLRRLLIEFPDLAETLNAAAQAKLQGRAAVTPPAAPATPTDSEAEVDLPPDIDPDDETSVRLWKELQDTKARITNAEEGQAAQQQREFQARVQADTAAGVALFRTAHPELSDEDIHAIRTHTAANVNVAGVMSNFPGDPATGIARALEIGSMTDPATRDKVTGTAKPADTTDAERQKKLDSLAGGSGTAPRRAPKESKPKTWNEVSQKLAQELEALGGTS